MTRGPTIRANATQRSIVLLSFATFSSMAAQRVCDAMLPELSRQFDVGLAQAAQVVSVFAVVYGVLQLFYGPLGDRLGKFRIIAWATLGCSIGNLVAVFATSLEMLLLSRALVAMGAAAIIPLTLAWLGDVADPAKLQETIARVGLGTALGMGGGQLLGGVLTDTVGWRWAFGLLAVLFCVVGVLLLRDWRVQSAHFRSDPLRRDTPPPAATGFGREARKIFADSWGRTILAIAVVEGAAGFGMLAIWASHLHRDMQFSLAVAGAVVALFGVGGVLYMATARHLIRRLRQPQLVVLGVSLVLVAALLIAWTPQRWLTVPASLVVGFGFFCFHNVMQANAAQMAPLARGTAVSLFAASLFLGQSLGVWLAAGFADRYGGGVVITVGGAVLFVLGLFVARALRRHQGLDLRS